MIIADYERMAPAADSGFSGRGSWLTGSGNNPMPGGGRDAVRTAPRLSPHEGVARLQLQGFNFFL